MTTARSLRRGVLEHNKARAEAAQERDSLIYHEPAARSERHSTRSSSPCNNEQAPRSTGEHHL